VPNNKPSKNARKREQQALVKLGEQLVALKDSELVTIELSEELLRAIRAAAGMKSHGALRRQKLLIGKLMRQADAEQIRIKLAALGASDRREKKLFAGAERWRDKLINDDKQALVDFETHIGASDAELRQLLGDLKMAANDKTEKTLKRQVFRRIHDILVRIPQ
jgi:ribosome-associated protein